MSPLAWDKAHRANLRTEARTRRSRSFCIVIWRASTPRHPAVCMILAWGLPWTTRLYGAMLGLLPTMPAMLSGRATTVWDQDRLSVPVRSGRYSGFDDQATVLVVVMAKFSLLMLPVRHLSFLQALAAAIGRDKFLDVIGRAVFGDHQQIVFIAFISNACHRPGFRVGQLTALEGPADLWQVL